MENKTKVKNRLQWLYNDIQEQITSLEEGNGLAWDTKDVDNWQSLLDGVDLLAYHLDINIDK